MKAPRTFVAVLAGGKGTRLTPLSTDDCPKQFLPLVGKDTMYQLTLARVSGECRVCHWDRRGIVTVCNEKHIPLAQMQACHYPHVWHLAEIKPRGTMPAAELAASYWCDALQYSEDSVMIVVPSDHYVRDTVAFRNALVQMTAWAGSGEDSIALMGIAPETVNDQYGYIVRDDNDMVTRFEEKPDKAQATKLIHQGALWNAGIFAMTVKTWRKYVVEDIDGSIDRQVIEPAVGKADMRVIPFDGGWSDVGTWESLQKVETNYGMRPWGEWEVLDQGEGYKVKRLTINPGHRTSLQRHKHRGEHWSVVAGELTVLSPQHNRIFVRPGEYAAVVAGELHQLCNEGNEPVVVIETQYGIECLESDIVRLDDPYGRKTA